MVILKTLSSFQHHHSYNNNNYIFELNKSIKYRSETREGYIEIITKDDLQVFGMNLLAEIRNLLMKNKQEVKDWLKAKEVRKLLNISSGTLLTLRATRKLRYSKIGGIYYYSFQDIQKMLDEASNCYE